jgi:hypothetical protein
VDTSTNRMINVRNVVRLEPYGSLKHTSPVLKGGIFVVTYMTKLIRTCDNCNAHNLCEVADEHREAEGFSKISVNSNECNECKEKYAESHASNPQGRGNR